MRFASVYSAISQPTNQTSPFFTRPYASSSDNLPLRRLLTSLPTRAIPHSSESSTSNRCLALRFSAIGRSFGLEFVCFLPFLVFAIMRWIVAVRLGISDWWPLVRKWWNGSGHVAPGGLDAATKCPRRDFPTRPSYQVVPIDRAWENNEWSGGGDAAGPFGACDQ